MAPAASAMAPAPTVGSAAMESAASTHRAVSPGRGPITAIVMECAMAVVPVMTVTAITPIASEPPDIAVPIRPFVVIPHRLTSDEPDEQYQQRHRLHPSRATRFPACHTNLQRAIVGHLTGMRNGQTGPERQIGLWPRQTL